MPSILTRCVCDPAISSPSKRIFPEAGRSIPAIVFKSVDLPAPLAPTTATISDAPTEIEMSEIATRPSYEVVSDCTSSMVAVAEISLDHLRIAHDGLRRAFDEHAAKIEHDGAVDQRHDDFHHVLD